MLKKWPFLVPLESPVYALPESDFFSQFHELQSGLINCYLMVPQIFLCPIFCDHQYGHHKLDQNDWFDGSLQ